MKQLLIATACALAACGAPPEQARTSIAERHRKAERDVEEGRMSDAQFRPVDAEYIAANNAIAAAQRAADDFLAANPNYQTR